MAAISKGLLLLGGLAGGLGLLAARKKPKAGEPGGTPGSAMPGAGQDVPDQVRAIMKDALATGDPARIRATADILEKQGYGASAADLRGAALIIEQEQAKQQKQAGQDMANAMVSAAMATGDIGRMKATAAELRKGGYTAQAAQLEQAAAILAKTTAATTAVTTSPTTIPQVIPASIPVPALQVPEIVVTPTATIPTVSKTQSTTSSGAALAGRTALMLRSATKATADEGLVQSFQTQEKLLKRDGKYGSETALALADRYDIVPPKPFYWGSAAGGYSSYVQDKRDYKSALLAKASSDPQRAEEWTAAAKV